MSEFLVNWNLEIAGNLSGSGGLLKTGLKTLTLSGTNSSTGPTRVQAGVLACDSATALGCGTLTLAAGTKLQLDYKGTRQIASLTVDDGKVLPNGSYGSGNSYAPVKDDAHFSGTGMVTIGSGKETVTTTTLALASGTSPSASKSSVTLTAMVAGRGPGGNVTFYDGAKALGTAPAGGSHQASLTTSTLAAGWHTLSVCYEGDAINLPAISPLLEIRVGAAMTR